MWASTKANTKSKSSGATAPRNATRRKRTSFSKENVELLLKTFTTDPYPGIGLREKLSHQTGLPESRIQVWFQNKRARTLKGGLPKSDDTDRKNFSVPPAAAPRRRQQGGSRVYQTQTMPNMDSTFYYPPVAYTSQNQGNYGSVFPPQGPLMGGLTGTAAEGSWNPSGASQVSAAPSMWGHSSMVVSNSNVVFMQGGLRSAQPAMQPVYKTPSSSFTQVYQLEAQQSGREENALHNALDNGLGTGLDNTPNNSMGSSLHDTLDHDLHGALDNTLGNTLDNTLGNSLSNGLDNTLGNGADDDLPSLDDVLSVLADDGWVVMTEGQDVQQEREELPVEQEVQMEVEQQEKEGEQQDLLLQQLNLPVRLSDPWDVAQPAVQELSLSDILDVLSENWLGPPIRG